MESFIASLTRFFVDWGYWGMFLSAALAGSILPLGSEVIYVLLLRMGLDPLGCTLAATAGNTLGGMSCYWMGSWGKSEWIARLGVSEEKLARARRFLEGKGALMGFFAFLPYLGEAIALALGFMRSNPWLTAGAMAAGKCLRYVALLLAFKGMISWI